MLFALVLAAWFPIKAWWQSDDYIALHYTQHFSNAIADFTGPQYDMPGVAWFYRPFITLSFWIEQSVFGTSPLISHLTNALAHAFAACMLGAISARFCGSMKAFLIGLLWGMAPLHTGSVMWAVGRVDSHTTLWVLWTLLLTLRYFDRRRRRLWPALLCALLAFGSKESALVLPALATVLVIADAPPPRRLRRALATWPFYALLGVVMVIRRLALGEWVGGYLAAPDPLADPGTKLLGLLSKAYHCVDPLPLIEGRAASEAVPFTISANWALLGLLPLAIAVVYLLVKRRWMAIWAAPTLFLFASIPAVHSWDASDTADNLRLFTLPFAALAFVIGAAGPVGAVLALLVFLLPTVQLHRDYFDVFRDAKGVHDSLRENQDVAGDSNLLLVAGLPRRGEHGNAMAFHLGVDRLLQPPFIRSDERARIVLALRPMSADPSANRLPDTDLSAPCAGLPTLLVEDAGKMVSLLPPRPTLDLDLSYEGPVVIGGDELEGMFAGEVTAAIQVGGLDPVADRVAGFRLTVFTAGGYVSCLVDAAPPAASQRIDLAAALLRNHYTTPPAPGREMIFGLETAIAVDLHARFPVLVEALDTAGTRLAANTEPLWIEFEPAVSARLRGRVR